ncbi:agglutinin biogenesis protein MshI [Massilia arenosa]|uniref:Agglutinin biogenesis protein MshI n=1 Tax=Zemynaea arenosa TaxID=2561931 RepID=A0A4Y9SCC4_9BURK|nr:agglutinin biogenesis protein MshI [Massilia arenosa]
MRFFRKAKTNDGLLAFAFPADGVLSAIVRRVTGARPVVELARFFPLPTLDADGFEKIGKELRAAGYTCGTVLAGTQYQILSVEAPNVPPDELKTAVRWRLKDMLDFHIDDATIDVLDVPVDRNGAGRTHNMFAIAARNALVKSRQDLFADAKVPLSIIDIPEMAQRNVAALVEPEGRALAMLSLSDDGGLLTVTYAGELHLARRIDISMEALTSDDYDRRNAMFDRITLELQRSLDHFDRQFSYLSLAKLVLAPTVVQGLEEYLSSNLYTPVVSMDLAAVLDFDALPELQDKAMQQRFFMTLGAALRHEEVAL